MRVRRVVAIDAALAGALLAAGQSQVWFGWSDGGVGGLAHGHELARAVIVAACTAPLAWRRSRPLVVTAVLCAALMTQLLAVAPQVPFLTGLLPLLVANYSTAVYAPAHWRAASLLGVGAVEAVMYLRVPAERVSGEVLFGAFVALGSWLAGDVVWYRTRQADRNVDQARALLAEREMWARRAADEERGRIARELHDVIAHSVSLMGVQAGAARIMLSEDPDAARAALQQIESAARTSVGELQRLLALLRGHEGVGRDPQPGLADLPALAERTRVAGIDVELSLSDLPPLDAGLDLAAYRIVQEALTNVLKHAHAPAVVSVCCAEGCLHIRIRDLGLGSAEEVRLGHGLAGMRERAQLYGGTLRAAPDPAGGFLVEARLPLSPEVPTWSG
ncbi:MAG TPA: sensor histidine kinase [Mycobacteriales bacterium]